MLPASPKSLALLQQAHQDIAPATLSNVATSPSPFKPCMEGHRGLRTRGAEVNFLGEAHVANVI